MFNIDENPFGDPIDNPFADQSIQQISRITEIQLNNYEPLRNLNLMPRNASENVPDVLQTTQETSRHQASFPQGGPPVLNLRELLKREEELGKKEKELAQREAEIRQSFHEIRQHNWPPLPEKCCFKPCFYQNIDVDIPPEFQKIVYQLYYLWFYHHVVMLANIFVEIMLGDFLFVLLSIWYTVLFTILSYITWFRSAYRAFRSDSSFNFMIFFISLTIQFVISSFQAIGIHSYGMIGLTSALKIFDSSVWGLICGIIALTVAVNLSFVAIADVYFLIKVHRIYRSSGGNFARAQQELRDEILQNENVRNITVNIASEVASSQFLKK